LIYFFENYSLDPGRRELRRGTEVVDVEPQVFDLLHYLIDNRERVVGKDDIIAAIWSGRTVSESALTSRLTAVRRAIGDTAKEQRLIRTFSRRGHRFVARVSEGPAASLAPVAGHAVIGSTNLVESAGDDARPTLKLPDRPSIAVMPFQNLSGDSEQDYFTDGVVEEIITALSRMRWLFVIARNSSFSYKGRTVDVTRVARELGVRYVLEGSVRKAANRMRITTQLIDTSRGVHLWADRFDGSLEEVFELQDRATSSVIGAIAPKLEQAEIERAKRKPTESLDAYDHYLRGMACVYRWSKQDIDAALRLFYQAIELDPDFASAYGVAAWCYFWRKANGWMSDAAQAAAETTRLAGRAADLGKEDAVALAFSGLALAYVAGEVDASMAMVDRALLLNPNLAAAWNTSGLLRATVGDPDTGLEHMARAMRLNPLDPLMFMTLTWSAWAHFVAGRYDQGWHLAERASREHPYFVNALRVAASCNALAGRVAEARRCIARALQLDPGMRISNLKDRVASSFPPAHFGRFVEGLRRAGMPE
jgi:TolB-like protein/Tfp pilus assembly protein PilF